MLLKNTHINTNFNNKLENKIEIIAEENPQLKNIEFNGKTFPQYICLKVPENINLKKVETISPKFVVAYMGDEANTNDYFTFKTGLGEIYNKPKRENKFHIDGIGYN